MKQNFKKGLAVVLSSMTALCVIAFNADGFIAIGGNLGLALEFACGALIFIIALPIWLMAITCWHKAHSKSYRAFKNWCIYQYNDILRAE